MKNYIPLLLASILTVISYLATRFNLRPGRSNKLPDELCVQSKFFKGYLLKPKNKISIYKLQWHLMEVIGFLGAAILYTVFGALDKLSGFGESYVLICSVFYTIIAPIPLLIHDAIIIERYQKSQNQQDQDNDQDQEG